MTRTRSCFPPLSFSSPISPYLAIFSRGHLHSPSPTPPYSVVNGPTIRIRLHLSASTPGPGPYQACGPVEKKGDNSTQLPRKEKRRKLSCLSSNQPSLRLPSALDRRADHRSRARRKGARKKEKENPHHPAVSTISLLTWPYPPHHIPPPCISHPESTDGTPLPSLPYLTLHYCTSTPAAPDQTSLAAGPSDIVKARIFARLLGPGSLGPHTLAGRLSPFSPCGM